MKTKSLIAAVLISTTSPSLAGYSVDTGTPTGPQHWFLSYDTPDNYQWIAGKFTLGAPSTNVATMESFFTTPYNLPGNVVISLFEGSITPETMLISKSTPVQGAAWKGISFPTINLGAGDYWVTFTNLTDDPEVYIRAQVPNPLPDYAYNNMTTSGTWVNRSWLDVGLRVSDEALYAVPEPASWALMVGGMGMIGASLRFRRIARLMAA